MIANDVDIPPELQPDPGQIPPGLSPEDEQRFELCFAVTRLLIGQDDPIVTRQLMQSDIPTGNLSTKIAGQDS